MTVRRLRERDDRGATIILLAISVVALFTIVAIVIDLGAVRSQRREGQSAADSATAAAGAALAEFDGVVACQDALDYLTINLDIPAFTGISCNATFSGACIDGVERTATGTSNEFTVTLVHPVSDASPLMGGTGIGSPAQAAIADDGSPCDRFGVQLEIDGNTFFGGVVGIADYDTAVHAVARVNSGTFGTRPLNLLLLDRTGCQTLTASGQATLVIEAPFDPSTGKYEPGIAAADSNGTQSSGPNGCTGNRAIIQSTGGGAQQSVIRSDGPCPSDPTMTIGCGDGRGLIEVFGGQGLTDGACDDSSEKPSCVGFNDASVVPNVGTSLGRFTRAPIDYRYNCKPSYASEPWYSSQDIPGCTNPAYGPYIDTLKGYASGISQAALPAGWTRLAGAANCSITGGLIVHPPGNYFVDCPGPNKTFSMSGGTVEFQGGNVVFNGDVSLSSSSSLKLNTCPPVPGCGSITWATGSPFTATQAAQSSADAAWTYIKGDFDKSASASIEFNNTMVVLAPSSGGMSFPGGAGSLVWTAPDLSTWAFDDLALWSESTSDIAFGGQTVLTLEGVFFTPVATVSYTGQGVQKQADAQFVALRLEVKGQGQFSILPAPNRSVEFPIDPTSGLIR